MSEFARVLDVQEMASFRALLVKVAESVRNGVATADLEMRNMKQWLDHEQPQVWARRIKKLQRQLDDAVETLRRKQLTPTPTGDPPNTLFEKKAVRLAKERIEEARARAGRTKQWSRKFDREDQLFRGNTQGARNAVQGTIPQAIRTLDELLGHLEEYMKLTANAPSPTATDDDAESVARPTDAVNPATDEQTNHPGGAAANPNTGPDTPPDQGGNP